VSEPPARPQIYHITHVENLASIIADGGLISDAAMIARGGPAAVIGMSTIKQRRLHLPVECHPGDFVGDYVPFYFCPRSIMLFVIYRANHPELTYRGGQDPIIHLEADLLQVVAWADAQDRRWAFSLSNAGAVYAPFRRTLADLSEIEWTAVVATDFRPASVKEGKQAEFLVYGDFPWTLVSRVGVRSNAIRARVVQALHGIAHRPPVEVLPSWYY
jgi:ssDNA thymidine ADP-ribosyltransferase, DarT